jgi:tRNA modification GTPase
MVFRISGPKTRDVVETIFSSDASCSFGQMNRQAIAGRLTLPSKNITCRAWLWVFRAPNSYTGQDVAELHLPSAVPLARLVEQELIGLGLEPAQPGEFTARAYLAGKIDLTEAEGINALVRAENDAQVDAALGLLAGRLTHAIGAIYEQLRQIVSLVEANIDFSEEDIELITLGELRMRIDELIEQTEKVIRIAVDSEALSVLPRVFLVGLPNAGKSSLLNRLTGVDRAICSKLPGTTRDLLTAVWRAGDREVLLVDTAGLGGPAGDELNDRAAHHTRNFLATADLWLIVFDLEADSAVQVDTACAWNLPGSRTIPILNKIDLADRHSADTLTHAIKEHFGEPIRTSALNGQGLARLTAAVFERLSQTSLTLSAQQFALNRRQRHALHRSVSALESARTDLDTLVAGTTEFGIEIVASPLQEALSALAELLGKDATENVLDTIFSQFCIGK